MATPIMTITDGTTRVDLLSQTGTGINIINYTPVRPLKKEGGIWADSSVANGRQLQMRKWQNAIDVLTIGISGMDQDAVIQKARNLTELLEKAEQYWTTEWQNEPVWLERKGSEETNTGYTLIHGYQWQNDDNPFEPPFFVQSKKRAMNEIELALEHGPWLANPPGQSECVEISNLMVGGELSNDTSNPTAQTDDAWVRDSSATINTADTILYVQYPVTAGNDYGFGVRFRNVAVPNGATITNAYIEYVVAYQYPQVNNVAARITGELNAAPAAFSTYANYNSRTRTLASTQWPLSRWSVGTVVQTTNIASIIQEIVDLGGWASGNDLVIFSNAELIISSGAALPRTAGGGAFASFDNTTYAEPELVIYYYDGENVGRTSTCLDEVYIANKETLIQPDYIYNYDASAAAYSANLVGAATPFNIFPNPIALGDLVYFGNTSAPFCSLVFDIGTVGNLNSLWQYWNGAAWVAVPNLSADNQNAYDFEQAGVCCVNWPHPSNWAKTIINGQNCYWIRVSLTVATTSPTQQNRDIYTVTRSSIDIDEDQVDGDIPAIAKISFLNSLDTAYPYEDGMICLRSTDRGERYKPYINFNGQNDSDISFTNGALTSAQTTTLSQTGGARRTAFAGVTASALRITTTLAIPLGQQYYGRYRAFSRMYCTGISEGDIQSTLGVELGTERLTKEVKNISSTAANYYYFDYGIISIPPSPIPESYSGNIDLNLYAGTDFGACNVDWLDLVLMPVDEYAIEIIGNNDEYYVTTLDSTSLIGKRNVFPITRDTTTFDVMNIPITISSSEIILQAQKNQRLYWHVMSSAGFWWVGRITIEQNSRYLTFRGDS